MVKLVFSMRLKYDKPLSKLFAKIIKV